MEEVPAGFTHALLLEGGRAVASGPIEDVLTAPALSDLYGVDLAVDRRDGRYAARAVTPAR